MPTQTEQAAFEQGVHAAYAAEDYLQEDGSQDKGQVREHLFEVLRQAKVLSKKERSTKAISRGELVKRVFPHLPGPDDFEGAEDPQLALSVWKEIDRRLWTEAKPSADSMLQRLVAVNMGNGYVMCRTKVGADRVDAAYITDDRACIDEDFVKPDNDSLERKLRAVTRNREMLVLRQPDNAQHWVRGYDRHVKMITDAGRQQLAITAEAASKANGNGDGGDNGEEDEA